MNTHKNASVQRYRNKMTAEGCARIEATLDTGLINQAREKARQKGWRLWQVVEAALLSYLKSDNTAETGNGKK